MIFFLHTQRKLKAYARVPGLPRKSKNKLFSVRTNQESNLSNTILCAFFFAKWKIFFLTFNSWLNFLTIRKENKGRGQWEQPCEHYILYYFARSAEFFFNILHYFSRSEGNFLTFYPFAYYSVRKRVPVCPAARAKRKKKKKFGGRP